MNKSNKKQNTYFHILPKALIQLLEELVAYGMHA